MEKIEQGNNFFPKKIDFYFQKDMIEPEKEKEEEITKNERAYMEDCEERFNKLVEQEKVSAHQTSFMLLKEIFNKGIMSARVLREMNARLAEHEKFNTNPLWQRATAERIYLLLDEYESDKKSGNRMDYWDDIIKNLENKHPRFKYFFQKIYPKYKNSDFEKLTDILQIYFGDDLISSIPASRVSHYFTGKEAREEGESEEWRKISALFSTEYDIYPTIFFDTPHPLRYFTLSGFDDIDTSSAINTSISFDQGVSNRITPSHFRALSFGDYANNVLTIRVGLIDISEIKNNDKENVSQTINEIKRFQDSGGILMDKNFKILPHLDEVKKFNIIFVEDKLKKHIYNR